MREKTLAAPTRRQHPVRTLLTLGVLIVLAFAAIAAGTKWSSATFAPKLALDLEGGTQVILTPVAQQAGQVTSTTINQAIDVIRQRVDSSGVAEAEITSQSGNKIVVSLPGHPSEETLNLVRTSAQMEFRPVLQVGNPGPTASATASATPTPGATTSSAATPAATPTATATAGANPAATASASPAASAAATPAPSPSASGPTSPSDTAYYVTPAVQAKFDALDCTQASNRTGGVNGPPDAAFVTCDTTGTAKYILGPVEVQGKHISSASSGLNRLQNGGTGNSWVVELAFDSTGTSQFAAVSSRLYSETAPLNRFGIVLDGLVIEAPTMNGVINNGQAEISGSFTRQSAATLASQLNFGALPISFQVESEQQISATLGSEQLQKGLLAGLIGMVLVVLYSLAQYRLLGLLTVASLVLAAIITYVVITLLSWTQGYRLSLPGVAGLIVAIGITADSFIVYFERIRDELREGRALGGAVERGWQRARRTILASDAVNFLAAAVLYALAIGSVRGFAFTLGLTTLIDLLIVFTFTHPMMEIISRWHFFTEGHRLSGLDPRRLGVPTTRYVGRGRVVTAGAPTAADVSAAEVLADTDSRSPVAVGTAAGTAPAAGMTIAERRAAQRRAQAAAPPGTDPGVQESTTATEGDEH